MCSAYKKYSARKLNNKIWKDDYGISLCRHVVGDWSAGNEIVFKLSELLLIFYFLIWRRIGLVLLEIIFVAGVYTGVSSPTCIIVQQ